VRVVTVDYRLAPENPYPAVDDVLASYRALPSETEPGQVSVAGESPGGE
jgi:acetyl esterase/lipase